MLQTVTLSPGQPVFTADQCRIGSIAEVRGPFVRVRRLFRKDLWLASNFVLWADERRIVMAFGIRDLARYGRRSVPRPPEPADDGGEDTPVKRLDADPPSSRWSQPCDGRVLGSAPDTDESPTAVSMHASLLRDYARHLRAELATVERDLGAESAGG